MSDVFKKVQEIEKKGIDSENDDFFGGNINNYEKISDMLKSLYSVEQNESFSSDLNKFNKDCSEFIEYIRKCIEDNESSILYMLRKGNVIHYGKFEHGVRTAKNVIEMISNQDLRNLYILMQTEFASDFEDGYHHTLYGWSLNPTIGENIIIDIDSDNFYDQNWFYEESHKEQEVSEPIKLLFK